MGKTLSSDSFSSVKCARRCPPINHDSGVSRRMYTKSRAPSGGGFEGECQRRVCFIRSSARRGEPRVAVAGWAVVDLGAEGMESVAVCITSIMGTSTEIVISRTSGAAVGSKEMRLFC